MSGTHNTMRNAQRVVKPGDKATGSQQTSNVAKSTKRNLATVCISVAGQNQRTKSALSSKVRSPTCNTQLTTPAENKKLERTSTQNQNPTTHIGDCVAASHLKKRQLKPGLQNKYTIQSKPTSSASDKLRVPDTAA